MSVKAFENNGKNVTQNIVKLKLEQNIKSLLYNHLVYICAEETDFWHFMMSLPDNTENPLWHSSQLKVVIELVWHIGTIIRVW